MMKRVGLLVCALATLAASLFAQQSTTIKVSGPTLIAFFPHVSDAELDKDADTNEALADFQLYAQQVRKPLQKAGIAFHEIYAKSFRLRSGNRESEFRTGKIGVGYYFVAPNKKPRIEYGVNTSDGILQWATEYFGIAIDGQSPVSPRVAPDSNSPFVAAPKLPYLDWNVCPGEGCQYAEWTARKPVAVYDTWKAGRKAIAHLAKGDKVTGVTGVVVTYEPGVIRMERDLPEFSLRRGDTLLTYSYRGEGFAAVWFQGHYYAEFDISFTRWPDGTGCGGDHCAATYVNLGKKTWWAQVKLKSGRSGWVNMNQAKFDGVDALG